MARLKTWQATETIAYRSLPHSDFFFGRLKEVGYWQEELAEKFRKDFGESL